MWACLFPPGWSRCPAGSAHPMPTVGNLILIRVLPLGLFPQDRACDLRERPTAGDRCEPLGSDGVWTKRGPSGAAQWSKPGLSVGRSGVAVLEAIGLGPGWVAVSWARPLPAERIALDSGRGRQQPVAAAIPV